ncbi:acyl-CoA dehydrogenase family protein [Chromohalobacter japonicus]|uniref:acyl-CoA dehydrogenase family protein n=1 Tax=Chromohalobacter japonicus TaxID=223900 RepID=UPI001FF11B93|nr:acyl-CoA dehydrogenase family protein [Chromohalobacter japonicus]MCK0754266.1 acyl-CoA dehydrogenase family protein [Chromohalobacter japonicus]
MIERDEYKEFRNAVRRLTESKIRPYASQVDLEARFPEEALDAFKELELVALPFDESIGGHSGDVLAQSICLEEIARGCAASSLTLMVIWAGLVPVAKHGSPKLIEEIVKPSLEGDVVASICLTEPHGGSDVWGAKTRAERKGEEWVINGQKRFISNASRSDWYTVLARTAEDSFGIFAVHKSDPGISFGKLESKMGVKGSPTADVLFENCRIPDYRCIGDPNQGKFYITESLAYTRPLIGAQALGIAQGAFDAAVQYIKEREVFGQQVARFQMVRGTIGDLATKIEAARQLLYRSCEAVDNGEEEARVLASMAKLFCSNVAMEVATEAVQLHGGSGYLNDFPVERMMRDAKIAQIYEGTSEIQKLIVAKSMLSN